MLKEGNKPIGEMLERNLAGVLEIFNPDYEWETQKRFLYDPDNKRKYYKVDVISETKKIIWEYDGPNHFNDTWKFQRDLDRDQYFLKLGYTVKRWSYYYQLTSDIAKNLFDKDYSEKKYLSAIDYVYGAQAEDQIFPPGWHETKFTPGSWIERGVDRLMAELDEMPESFKHQIAYALILYIESVGDAFLVLGDHKKLHDLIKLEIKRGHTNFLYPNL
jgi:hypothetical protein|tara:strand:+ start:3076 stop:3726 length:651 start_codon:yes stop_codon:yes gene_type:complete